MKAKPTLLLIGLIAASLSTACRNPSPSRSVQSLTISEPAAQHAVHSEQLRKIMWQLALAPTDRLPQELDVEKEQRWRRDDAVRVLGEMAKSAEAIPGVLDKVDLSDAQKAEFRRLASGLKNDARRLRDDVGKLSPKEIGDRFNSLTARCNACHDRFRVLPVITGSSR